jgi:hypothetical protein
MTSLNIGDWLGWTTETKIYWYEVKNIVEHCDSVPRNKPGVLIHVVGGEPIWHDLDYVMSSKRVIKATTKEKLVYNLKTNLIVYE